MAFPKWLNLYVCIFSILVSLLIAYLSRYGPRNIQRDESPLDDPEASVQSQMDFWLLFHTTEILFYIVKQKSEVCLHVFVGYPEAKQASGI